MSSMRALMLGLLLIAPSFAHAVPPGLDYGAPRSAVAPAIKAAPQRTGLRARIASGAKKTFATIGHPMIISGIINGVGSVAIHEMFGVPYDRNVIGTFMVVGTAVGAGYFPALAKIKAWARGGAQAP
jgi:hypothetical protein